MHGTNPYGPKTDGHDDRQSSHASPSPPEVGAAGLFAALQARPGHVVVVGEDADAAERFFARGAAELACHRRIRVVASALDPGAVVHALGADIASHHSFPVVS